METYRYTLEKSSRKHLCPECNKFRFVRYIDTGTNELLPYQYGRCDREINCGYHLNPYLDGYNCPSDSSHDFNNKIPHSPFHPAKPKIRSTAFIPAEILKKTRQGWEQNTFLQNLLNRIPYPFSTADIEKIIVQYLLGTVLKGYMPGAVTFPFIDELNNICAVQVKQFDKFNHTTRTSFLHSVIESNLKNINKPFPDWLTKYNQNESKVSCLFGAHLLPKYPKNPVALVEAPKSAIVGTLYYGFPDSPERLLWLAVYNLSSLSLEKCKVLKGRTVILFPDLSKEGRAFRLWSEKVKSLEKQIPGTRFIIYDLLEQKAGTQAKLKGYDLADFLIQFDHRAFRNQNPAQPTSPTTIKNKPLVSAPKNITSSIPDPKITKLNREDFFPTVPSGKTKLFTETWDLQSLESFFSTTQLPDAPLRLDQCTIIHHIPTFISGHLAILYRNNGNPVFLPYFNRLKLCQQILKSSEII